MTQAPPPDLPSRDLYVRVALLEQAQLHSEDRAELQREMAANRHRAAEEQIGRVASRTSELDSRLRDQERWSIQTASYLTQQGADMEDLRSRRIAETVAGDRLKYGIAAALFLLAILAGVAPEHIGKIMRLVALVP
jgi:ATPase subunit of ABC transporter with duplicated ATPase domains